MRKKTPHFLWPHLCSKGFTLPEILVSSLLLGLVALGVTHMTKNQLVYQKHSSSTFDVDTLMALIEQNLTDHRACGQTLGTSLSDGMNLNSIKDQVGTELVIVGTQYGNNESIQLDAIVLENFTSTPDPIHNNSYAQGNLKLSFKKTSKALQEGGGSRLIHRTIPLQMDLDSSADLFRCRTIASVYLEMAKRELCRQISGIYDTTSDPLNHTCDISQLYVDTSGDTETMNGNLTLEAQLKTNQGICLGNTCRRSFAPIVCPHGQVLDKINEDGTATCATITCSDPLTFFAGRDATGTPLCLPFPTDTCPTNQYTKEIKPNGDIICERLPSRNNLCPTGWVSNGLNDDGTLKCTPFIALPFAPS